MNHLRRRGFSLLELIVFIIVVGIAVSGVFMAFTTALQKVTRSQRQAMTIALAQQRMELMLGQRRLMGFANFSDPCKVMNPPSACNLPAELANTYKLTATIANYGIGGDNSYQLITVIADGPGDARTELNTLIGRY